MAKRLLEEKQISVIDVHVQPAASAPAPVPPVDSISPAPGPPQRPRGRLAAGVMIVLALVGYNFLGFYSIQPIGAIPDGQTWLVMRSNDEPFFESADARCLRRVGSVSLLTRGLALGQAPKDQILIRLPYWKFAYLQSTGGREFDH